MTDPYIQIWNIFQEINKWTSQGKGGMVSRCLMSVFLKAKTETGILVLLVEVIPRRIGGGEPAEWGKAKQGGGWSQCQF